MTSAFSASVYAKTPSVTVVDNRGLTVRELAWRRIAADSATELLVTRHQYSAQDSLTESIDPRLGAAREEDSSVKANFTWAHDLTGNVLRTDSVDAGITVALADIEGRPLSEVSANSVTRRYGYETAPLPGRLLQVTEQCRGEKEHIIEHVVWAGTEERDANLVGTAKKHYDAAGLEEIKALSLSNAALYATRRILADGKGADWSGKSESAWAQALAPEIYAIQSLHDATGALLTQTDACGHMQRMTYDIAGQMRHSHLMLQGGREQTVVESVAYSAAGQKLREEHGNGVLTEYGYEPETQRLLSMRTVLSKDGKEDVLQDLRYAYDPVGNVLQMRNDAEKRSFWRNQKVEPENRYAYDSLYQLISTSGREMANIGKQNATLPEAYTLLPDDTVYTTYTRSYTYDNGGNLTRVNHRAPAGSNSYALNITVSSRSNRAVMKDLTESSDEVDALFDAAGNQRYLQKGQPLIWNGNNELRQVIQAQRETDQKSDREWYRYAGGSARVLKVSMAGNRQQRVVYLPGLEQRITLTGGKVSEDLQVITVGQAGRAQVRVLHWQSGKPGGVANDQVRYSYDNLIGSSQLELDATGAIISKEEYYPYGGTAVWAARSKVEAGYKTIRYSGKERDATGLYYYGYRYYQPWVARWLKPDPAGTVDGLNVYRMVSSNPITLTDSRGLWGYCGLDYLGIDAPNAEKAKKISMKYCSSIDVRFKFNNKTQKIIEFSKHYPTFKEDLPNYAAHSGYSYYYDTGKLYDDEFVNIKNPEQYLRIGSHFPGIKIFAGSIIPPFIDKEKKKNKDENKDENKKGNKKKKKKENKKKKIQNGPLYYKVTNQKKFIDAIKEEYTNKDTGLHRKVKDLIIYHINYNEGFLPAKAGIAGLHAEVQALNALFTKVDENAENGNIEDGRYIKAMLQSDIFTEHLLGKKAGTFFPACHNCSGILSSPINVITGRVETSGMNYASKVRVTRDSLFLRNMPY